jgi:hypothetical protein
MARSNAIASNKQTKFTRRSHETANSESSSAGVQACVWAIPGIGARLFVDRRP